MILLLAALGIAFASSPLNLGGEPPLDDPQMLISDLLGEVPKDRLYAARELRRQARRAVGDLHSRDDIRSAEARLLLEQFDHQLAPACIAALSERTLAGLCADVLRTLETTAAIPALKATSSSLRGGRARRVDRAIQALEAL